MKLFIKIHFRALKARSISRYNPEHALRAYLEFVKEFKMYFYYIENCAKQKLIGLKKTRKILFFALK